MAEDDSKPSVADCLLACFVSILSYTLCRECPAEGVTQKRPQNMPSSSVQEVINWHHCQIASVSLKLGYESG